MTNWLDRGLTDIAKAQQSDGSFLSYSSPDPLSFDHTIEYKTTFTTSQILYCLTQLPTSKLRDQIIDKAVDYLLSQRSDDWSWNYWDRSSKDYIQKPYPDDLDDTFCALSALYLTRPELFTGDVLAKVTRLLVATEATTGGPYRTWLIESEAPATWKNIDVAVNANLAYFLKLQDIELPSLTDLFEKTIASHHYSSPYYPNQFSILFFLSRAATQSIRSDLLGELQVQKPKHVLDKALHLLTLKELGAAQASIQPFIDSLTQSLTLDWSVEAFCLDPAINHEPHYSGSPALTTAFCLAALYRKSPLAKPSEAKTPTIYQEINQAVFDYFDTCGQAVATSAQPILNRLLRDELGPLITLLPANFAQTLEIDIPADLLTQLGQANLFGWIAYVIYDDIMDGDSGGHLLPIANLAQRQALHIFETVLPIDSHFSDLALRIWQEVDKANLWEIENARDRDKLPDYGDYRQLANRSLGHILGPLAILFHQGYNAESTEVKQTIELFSHYLIARQLNDDAHDWKKDLIAGHVNAVGAMFFKTTTIKQPVANQLDMLEKEFWRSVIEQSCQEVIAQTEQALTLLSRMSFVRNPEPIRRLLNKECNIAQQALDKRADTLKFLQTFNP